MSRELWVVEKKTERTRWRTLPQWADKTKAEAEDMAKYLMARNRKYRIVGKKYRVVRYVPEPVIGAPACFLLEQCCQIVNDAFGNYGCYLVGSACERQDWRDVDVRFIMPDEEFYKLFPRARTVGAMWEFDPRWLLLTVSIAQWMSTTTGLPIDFQIQPQTFANEKHQGQRHAIGLRITPPGAEEIPNA